MTEPKLTPKWNPELLTFDPENHAYAYDGRRVPGVSRILDATGFLGDMKDIPEFYAVRGTHVHLACEYWDQGVLNWETLDPALEPYVRAYEKFHKEWDFKILLSEAPVYNPSWDYAGTVDRVGHVDGNLMLIDIKTGKPKRWAKLQTALYADCFREELDRRVLRLDKDGGYALSRSHNDPADETAAYGAAACARWQRII